MYTSINLFRETWKLSKFKIILQQTQLYTTTDSSLQTTANICMIHSHICFGCTIRDKNILQFIKLLTNACIAKSEINLWCNIWLSPFVVKIKHVVYCWGCRHGRSWNIIAFYDLFQFFPLPPKKGGREKAISLKQRLSQCMCTACRITRVTQLTHFWDLSRPVFSIIIQNGNNVISNFIFMRTFAKCNW